MQRYTVTRVSLVALTIKNLPAMRKTRVRPLGWRSAGEGNSYPLQYSYLGNAMDRGVWQATVPGFTKISPSALQKTQLSN